jgi:hypothetical protein
MSFSRHESWIRLPSVFSSMVSLALTFALARRLAGRRAALTAVSLLAVAPLSIWYAQEARMVIFVVPAALLIALGLHEGSWRGGGLILAGLAAGLYFDYTIIPLWIILSSIWLVVWWNGRSKMNGRSRRPLFFWLAGSLGGWLAFSPLWSHLVIVISRLGDIFIVANILGRLGLPDLGALVYLVFLLLLAIGTMILTWLWFRLSKRPSIFRLLTVLVLIGFILWTLLVPVPRLYSVKRVVVTGWPFATLFVALLIVQLKQYHRRVWASLLLLSLAVSVVSLWLIPKDDWRGAVAYIQQQAVAGEAVWLDPSSGFMPYQYYRTEFDSVTGREPMLNPPAAGIWHIAERQPGRPVPGSAAESWLDQNRPLLEAIPFYRLEVRHYGQEK